MLLPSWLWRILRSKGFRALLVWSPVVVLFGFVCFYAVANLRGKKEWDEAVEKLNTEGYPSTLNEALGEPPVEGVSVLDYPVVLDEIRRIKFDDEPLTSVVGMGLSGLKTDVFMGEPGGKVAPDPSAFFAEPLSAFEAATKLLGLLEPFENRRRDVVKVCPDWWQNRTGLEGEPDPISFLNHASGFLVEHAQIASAGRRHDLVMEDLWTLLSWNAAIQETKQSLMGSLISIGYQSLLLELVEEVLIGGELEDSELQRLSLELDRICPEKLTGRGIKSWVSSVIEEHEPMMADLPTVDWDSWFSGWDYDRDLVARKWDSLVIAFSPKGLHESSYAVLPGGIAQEAEVFLGGHLGMDDLQRYRARADLPRVGISDLDYRYLDPPYSESYWETLRLLTVKTLRVRSRLNMVRVTCCLEGEKRKDGAFPSGKKRLRIEFQDPFCNGDFGYRLEADGGFTLWSVGPDGVDDSGSGDDLSFRRWIRKP